MPSSPVNDLSSAACSVSRSASSAAADCASEASSDASWSCCDLHSEAEVCARALQGACWLIDSLELVVAAVGGSQRLLLQLDLELQLLCVLLLIPQLGLLPPLGGGRLPLQMQDGKAARGPRLIPNERCRTDGGSGNAHEP